MDRVEMAPDNAFWQRALATLQEGGPVMSIVMALSIIAMTIVFLKLCQFARLRIGAQAFVETALAEWHDKRPREALAVLRASPNPVARVLESAMAELSRPNANEESVREEVLRIASVQLKQLSSYLRGLESIATLAPLLGLLGTVLGMIEAFQAIESSRRAESIRHCWPAASGRCCSLQPPVWRWGFPPWRCRTGWRVSWRMSATEWRMR
jgi:biopolymer transport protein ExbB